MKDENGFSFVLLEELLMVSSRQAEIQTCWRQKKIMHSWCLTFTEVITETISQKQEKTAVVWTCSISILGRRRGRRGMKLEYKFQVGRVLTYSLLHTQGIWHEFNKYLSNESWRRFFQKRGNESESKYWTSAYMMISSMNSCGIKYPPPVSPRTSSSFRPAGSPYHLATERRDS